ncbi:MAG TPA: DUF4038 domain-containing protein [Nitrospira sp.]|nr:DUF4038 domain-containing protein [Nitrospira sp.]
MTLPEMTFSQSSDSVEVYDFLEVAINVAKPTAQNPFTEVFVTGSFGIKQADQGSALAVDGFCDSADGSVFRIRFMPMEPGDYVYSVTYWQDNLQKAYRGEFKAVPAMRRGIVSVDPAYPWHFIWKGTGEHYFLNGTTAYLLMGWDDEKVIRESIDRLSALDVNRMRVLLDGRSDHFWTEPIRPGNGFHARLNPWVAKHPDDVSNPEFDFTRFNLPHWEKFERMLRHAREKDMIVSVILGWHDNSSRPSAGSEDERRYIRYAVARLGAYSNVTWDLGDDLDSYRDDPWAHATGTFIYKLDPNHHLATSHPTDNRHQDRSSSWFGMTSYQQWKRPLHEWMLDQRRQQASTGRIIPQVNEEYGYEDHYPGWTPYKAPAASADGNRRVAWEIAMAGGYQTTGETAKRGTGVDPDTGGGWVNGRGDDTMTMLKGYAHMVHFFTGFEWWKTDPHDELVSNGSFCLAEPGQIYVIYMPHGGNVTARLEPGRYQVKWFNPRNGEYIPSPLAEGSSWTSTAAPDGRDWVILLTRLPAK